MGNAALKTQPPEPRLPTANRETRQHEKLVRELNARLLTVSREVPTARGAVPVPLDVLIAASGIGYTLIGLSSPHPPSVNVAATEDGEIILSILGVDRKVDVWVERADGTFSYIAKDGARVMEGDLREAEAMKLTEWLAARTATIG
ncbi:MAG: hypothetical protein JNJ54_34945 [Myxococcaceae bacterium]|nr:hypothetical protein [Myxococcaceae bacterium]